MGNLDESLQKLHPKSDQNRQLQGEKLQSSQLVDLPQFFRTRRAKNERDFHLNVLEDFEEAISRASPQEGEDAQGQTAQLHPNQKPRTSLLQQLPQLHQSALIFAIFIVPTISKGSSFNR